MGCCSFVTRFAKQLIIRPHLIWVYTVVLQLSDMTNLAKILTRSNIVLDLVASSKKQAFEQAGLLFEANCGIAHLTVTDNLLARETLGSTGLGHGVAVPHGRIKGLKSAMAAFVRLKEAIPFDSPDGKPVNLLVFLLIPDNVTQQHLEILSEVAEIFSNAGFREMLALEHNAESVYTELIAWKPGRQNAA